MTLRLLSHFFCAALAIFGPTPASASSSLECAWIADHPAFVRLDELFHASPSIQQWNVPELYTPFGIVQRAGQQLAYRLRSPYDDHVHALVDLGFSLRSDAGIRTLNPGSQITFIQNYNGHISELVASGKRKEDEVFWYTLLIKDLRTGKTEYLRPGLDPLPPPEFIDVVSMKQISHIEWEALAARGYLIGDFEMFDHFTGHLTELLVYKEKSALLRRYYDSRVHSDRHEFQLLFDESRMQIADEALALPRLDLEDHYRNTLPFVFSRNDKATLHARKQTLQVDSKQDPVSFLELTEKLIITLEPTLRLAGGSIRDSYNRFKLLIPAADREYRSPDRQNFGRNLAVKIFDGVVIGAVIQSDQLLAHIEYLKISLLQLKQSEPSLFRRNLDQQISSPLYPVYGVIPAHYTSAMALEHIAGIRAHIESVLVQTLRLKMSPEQMLKDLIDDLPEDSVTRQFVRSCYDERSPVFFYLAEHL